MADPYIPSVVQAQADASDKLFNELTGQSQQTQSTPAALEAPPATPPAPPPQPSEDWEHKYRVLQGKYNAEVPRLNDQVRQLQSGNQQLQTQLSELGQQVQQLQQEKASTPPPEFDKLKTEYGEDLVSVLTRQNDTITKLNAQIADLQRGQQQVAQATHETVADGFWRELRRSVPDWQQINTDPGFLNWLNEADGFSGYSRYDNMQGAFRRFDADGVSRFFAAYKDILNSRPNPQQQLQQQIAPNASGGNAQLAAQEKPSFTQAQVSAFFKELSLGKWNHRMEEARQIERKMEQAQIEGRIR